MLDQILRQRAGRTDLLEDGFRRNIIMQVVCKNPESSPGTRSRPEEACVTPGLRSDLNVAPGRDFGKRRESVADATARDNLLDRLSILSGMEYTGAVHASLAHARGQ